MSKSAARPWPPVRLRPGSESRDRLLKRRLPPVDVRPGPEALVPLHGAQRHCRDRHAAVAIGAFASSRGSGYAQREVAFVDIVRSSSDAGCRSCCHLQARISHWTCELDRLSRSTEAHVLKIERDGGSRVSMQLLYWETDVVAQWTTNFGCTAPVLDLPGINRSGPPQDAPRPLCFRLGLTALEAVPWRLGPSLWCRHG